MNPAVNGVCDASCLELGKDTVPQMTAANCFAKDWQQADHIQ